MFSRAGSLVFVAVYIFTSILSFTLAAPLLATPQTSIVPAYGSGVQSYTPPQISALRKRNNPLHVVRSERETQHLVRRKSIAAKIRNAFKKIGKGIAKVAKVGLKVAATVGSVVGKAANFIPGVGKAISGAIKVGTIAANTASNKIKANVGKFGKASGIMDKIQHPGGAALNAVLKRDVGEWVL